jgi:hypothetical protein
MGCLHHISGSALRPHAQTAFLAVANTPVVRSGKMMTIDSKPMQVLAANYFDNSREPDPGRI